MNSIMSSLLSLPSWQLVPWQHVLLLQSPRYQTYECRASTNIQTYTVKGRCGMMSFVSLVKALFQEYRSCQGSTYRNFRPQNLITDRWSIRASGGDGFLGINQQCFFQGLLHQITVSVRANPEGYCWGSDVDELDESERYGGELHCVCGWGWLFASVLVRIMERGKSKTMKAI